MRNIYTEEEKLYIKLNYRTKSNVEIGKYLNRSAASIRKKRFKLKLNRTPKQLKKIRQRNPNLFQKKKQTKIISDKGALLMFGVISK